VDAWTKGKGSLLVQTDISPRTTVDVHVKSAELGIENPGSEVRHHQVRLVRSVQNHLITS
jgi:hypothetical protein